MIESIVDDNERILWRGKPDIVLYIVGNPAIYLVAIFWGLFDLFLISDFLKDAQFLNGFIFIFFLFHLFHVWFAIIGPIFRLINYRTVEYAITDKRVYVSRGIFGRDINTLEHREITNLSVDVNFLENIRKVGTLNLFYNANVNGAFNYRVSSDANRFISIEDPYGVYKLLKKVSLDVTTDQAFPNAYRPKENTGYNTEYK